MKELEIDTFLTSDYIYIPYISKEKLNLRSNGCVFKDDLITDNTYSPVSGKAIGLTEIFGFGGVKKTLIVENDFKDSVEKKKISVKDLYSLDSSIVIEKTNKFFKGKELNVNIEFNNKFDLRDNYILKDNISIILETLNILDNAYKDININILMNKRDLGSYQTLFTYLGTYPNIKVSFKNTKNDSLSLYDVIDIYNDLKNRNSRDFVYVTLIHDNKIRVIKLKKNSNLKDLLEHIKVMGTTFIINNTIKVQNPNFLLDENVRTININ